MSENALSIGLALCYGIVQHIAHTLQAGKHTLMASHLSLSLSA